MGTVLLPKAKETLEFGITQPSITVLLVVQWLTVKTRLTQSHGHENAVVCKCSILKLFLKL